MLLPTEADIGRQHRGSKKFSFSKSLGAFFGLGWKKLESIEAGIVVSMCETKGKIQSTRPNSLLSAVSFTSHAFPSGRKVK
jgi:hypothetical protein